MKRIILFVLIFAAIGYSQIPVFSHGAKTDGAKCDVKTFSSTDTSYTAQVYWPAPYTMFTGAATLCGSFQLISGTDTVTTIKARLIMRTSSDLTSEAGTMVYDSTGYHTLASGSGNWIPAENGVSTTLTPFSIDLADEAWWKPCIGIEVQFIQSAMFGTGTKEVEAYLILQRYNY